MSRTEFSFTYQVFESTDALNETDAMLLKLAQKCTGNAYAPYSGFRVGAAALLENGETITGSNQENASYPVGICAERTLLATAGNRFPGVPIKCMAVSYDSDSKGSNFPITPCGMCRQALQEFEERTKNPVRLVLGGMNGPVMVIEQAGLLLPLAFTPKEMKK